MRSISGYSSRMSGDSSMRDIHCRYFSEEIPADSNQTHIRGSPKHFPPIGDITYASLLTPLAENFPGKRENAALAVKPSILVNSFHWGLRRGCLSRRKKFIVAIRWTLFRRRWRVDIQWF